MNSIPRMLSCKFSITTRRASLSCPESEWVLGRHLCSPNCFLRHPWCLNLFQVVFEFGRAHKFVWLLWIACRNTVLWCRAGKIALFNLLQLLLLTYHRSWVAQQSNKSHDIVESCIFYFSTFLGNLFNSINNGPERTHYRKFQRADRCSVSFFMSTKSVISMALMEWNLDFASLFFQIKSSLALTSS
jgi:hypothetical protein